uniref:5'-AMP-activated protein kinase subunit beta-1 n=1 Tax=Strongyloides papillosus TaxID=174720 RepID=A0A0N5BQA2_STREA
MGNNQGTIHKRDRMSADSRGGTNRNNGWVGASESSRISGITIDDDCPVQVKLSKNDMHETGDMNSCTPSSIQFAENNEYPVVFKWQGSPNNKAVYISGSWDNWERKIPLVKSTQDFTTIVNLNEGKYEYKYFVDGKWMTDDRVPRTTNSIGTENNVIEIVEDDFEVFQALNKDYETSNAGKTMKKIAANDNNGPSRQQSHDTPNDRELEKLKDFTQIIPERKYFQDPNSAPPVLPPHLLQVILNKDTQNTAVDPNLLPEPNHVMLNHLYALSIRDGVMVLSTTHRYRKKYITSLLYKPI